MRSLMVLFVAAFLAASMVLTCVPSTVSGDEMPITENWPVFRPSAASTFVEPSMAVDGNGSLHLAYAYDPTPGDDYSDMAYHRYSVMLRYAVLTNGSWDHHDLGEEEWIQHVAIALGPQGEPHLLCLQGGANYTFDVFHWYRSNGTWASEFVRTLPNIGFTPVNMVVDSNDRVHLAFSATLHGDYTYVTHTYMTNAGGNWTSDEIVTVRSSYAVWNNPPQLAMNDEGRMHMAYLNVTDYDIEDWYSGNHSLEFLTLDNGEWGDLHVLNVGALNRFSFGVANGYESVIYQQTDQIWNSNGKVRLATRYDFGWSFKPYDEDGTSSCQLIMDGHEAKMLVLREGGTLLRLEYSEGNWQERFLKVPDGMRPYGREFASGTWDHLCLLYFDELTGSIAVSRPGRSSQFSVPSVDVDQHLLEVTVIWDEVNTTEADLNRYVLYRTGGLKVTRFPHAEFPTGYVDSTLTKDDVRHTLVYRLSVVTEDNEEYVGEATSMYVSSEEAYGEADPWSLVKIAGNIAILAIAIVVIGLLLNRRKLNR